MSRGKIIIGLTVFVDVVGIGIVIPVLPVFLHGYIDSPFWIEMFFAIYAFCGFFAAPILGALSDKYGRRLILILSIFGTAVGWFIFALGSKSLICLVIGRIIDGITSGNISTAQSYMVDISKNKIERTKNLGFIGAIFGIGFIVGPAIGGVLSKFSLLLPFFFTAGLATLNAVSAYLFLPESHAQRDHERKISMNPFKDIFGAFGISSIRPLLISWFLYTICFGIVQAAFSLYGYLAFGFSPTMNGAIMAMIGVVIAINQGFLLKNLWLKYFSENRLAIMSTLWLMAAYGLMAIHSIYVLIIALILSAFGQSLTRVINNSSVSHLVPPKQVGTIMGVMQSIMFLSAILAPIIGGIALEYNLMLPWLISAGLMVIALVIIQTHYSKMKKIELFKEIEEPIVPEYI
ncbi:MAG: MFS transporter [Candidatus Gracilibacteria bacterium]|jgi:DHA1 family tetracycline resistance protein-like MFS transporter